MLEVISGFWAAAKSHIMIAVTVVALVTVGAILWRDQGLIADNKALTSSLDLATKDNAAQKNIIDTYQRLRAEETRILDALNVSVDKIEASLDGTRADIRKIAENDQLVKTYLATHIPDSLRCVLNPGGVGCAPRGHN